MLLSLSDCIATPPDRFNTEQKQSLERFHSLVLEDKTDIFQRQVAVDQQDQFLRDAPFAVDVADDIFATGGKRAGLAEAGLQVLVVAGAHFCDQLVAVDDDFVRLVALEYLHIGHQMDSA